MPHQTSPPDDKRQNGGAIPSDKLLQPPSLQQQQLQQEIVAQKPVVEDETPTADVVVPLDGGWGWVVVAASFFCNLIVDGIVMNASLISTEIAKEFQVSTSEVSRRLTGVQTQFRLTVNSVYFWTQTGCICEFIAQWNIFDCWPFRQWDGK